MPHVLAERKLGILYNENNYDAAADEGNSAQRISGGIFIEKIFCGYNIMRHVSVWL